MGEGDIAVPDRATAEARMTISLRPDVTAKFEATVPARHTSELLVVANRVAVLALAVVASMGIAWAAHLAGLSSTCVTVLMLPEVMTVAVVTVVSALSSHRVRRNRRNPCAGGAAAPPAQGLESLERNR